MGTAVDSLGQRHDFGYVIQNKEVSGIFTVLFDKAGKIVDRNLSPEDLEKRLDMIFSVPEGAEIQWDSL